MLEISDALRSIEVELDSECLNFCVANIYGGEWGQIYQVGKGWEYTSHSVDLFFTHSYSTHSLCRRLGFRVLFWKSY